MRDVLIIIPTYNEIENIENIIISTINLYPTINILIVDDNSPDLTSKKVENLKPKFKDQLFLMKRLKKEGLGTAYVAGFKWALKNKFNYVFEMDADLSHNPKDIKRILEPMLENNYDVSIGSRYIEGINVVNWPLSRIILSYTASQYVQLITRMNIKDSTSGYICYKKSVLESIDLDNIKFTGYAFQIEMKYKSYLKNFKIIEVPIIFSDRLFGVSKLNGSIISEAIFGVIAMRIKNIFNIKF
ncbi:polyprenol monophosphomannose synthase [Flavobacteriaceae bacterium]|nr:polyprenol monophosphomannose synthase [Flavobacteriaceae bacterium]